MTDRIETYSRGAILLHWLIALSLVIQVALGFVMVGLDDDKALQFKLFQLHKSIGITILLLMVARLAWRLTYRPPPLPEAMPRWERGAAIGTHHLLYLLAFLLPLTGWAMVSASPLNIPTVLYGIIPWPDVPVLPDLDNKKQIEEALGGVHEIAAWFLIVAVGLHVGAALRHHFILRDAILSRMLPLARRG